MNNSETYGLLLGSILIILVFPFVTKASTDLSPKYNRIEKTIGLYQIICPEHPQQCKLVKNHVISHGSLASLERELLNRLQADASSGNMNIPLLTLGGKQFWADTFVRQDWRIQQNVFTGHYRLLDPNDIRRAWGTYPEMRAVFERMAANRLAPIRSNHVVFLIHGLFRSKDSWQPLEDDLEKSGFEVETVNYPSTRRSLDAHVDQLASILEQVDYADTVSFVTHSLGGLIVRKLLAGNRFWKSRLEPRRVVMIAPPNKGSDLLEGLKRYLPVELIVGPVTADLLPDSTIALPSPDVPFGIISGGRSDTSGLNPWLQGDDDGTVRVDSTRLEGAADYLTVEGTHSFIMNNAVVRKQTVHFLKQGKFSD